MTFEEAKKIKQTEIIDKLKVKTYLGFDDINYIINQLIIPNVIVENKQGIKEINYVQIEICKRIFILGECTILDISDIVEGKTVEFANWSNVIWDKVVKKIKNYDIFNNILNSQINQTLKQFTQIEYKIIEIIDTFSEKIKSINLEQIAKNIDPKLFSQFSQLKDILPKIETEKGQ